MTDASADRRAIGRWLAIWAATVFVLVLVGGGTRLTESGLSITEWKPLSGVIPPFNDAAWQAEFEKYKQIPQYAQMNAGMSLAEFKGIFWWEFIHRMLARLGGLVFAVPFFWFLARRRIPRELMPRLVTIGTLLIAQAALGWYMVASGLVDRVNVSQYRLAAHLALALVIYGLTVWTADALITASRESRDESRELENRMQKTEPPHSQLATGLSRLSRLSTLDSRLLTALLVLTAFTVISGAFVAGLRAGRIYNEFPMMGAGLIPIEYGAMSPWWKNLFENPAAAQFNHRFLAIATLLAVAIFWFKSRKAAAPALRQRLDLVIVAAVAQVALGITVLLLGVPVLVGVAHQAGALLVLSALTLALREASA